MRFENRHATHPAEYVGMDSAALRERFIAPDLFIEGEISLLHSHEDRMVVGGVIPAAGLPLQLGAPDALRADYFCERRELAVVNIGGTGTVVVDGKGFDLSHRDSLYIGRGARNIEFHSGSNSHPAAFFLASAHSDVTHPTTRVTRAEAQRDEAGDNRTANRRVIEKYIHADGAASSQLVLGITSLEAGSVWNSMPPHLHDRRTEMYLYFDLDADARLFHMMGEPREPRVMVMADRELVVAPSWSMHFGSGTTNYAFIWVMAGENQAFTDMDQLRVIDI